MLLVLLRLEHREDSKKAEELNSSSKAVKPGKETENKFKTSCFFSLSIYGLFTNLKPP